MKKLVSFLLALVLTLSLTTEALAAVVSPKADATEITADQTVKLTVTASEDEKLTGIVCLNYRVYFDPAFFELDADASAAQFEGAKLTALKTDDRGSYYAVSLLDTTSAGLTVSGDLYTLAFKVKDGAKVGDTSKLTLVKAYVYTIEDGAMKLMDNGTVENGEVTVKIISSRPANVTLVSAKAVSGGIQVTWKEAAGAATYKVYRKDAANPDWTALTTTATGTSYVDKTAKAGVKYTYTVRGVASDGKTLSPSHDKTGVSAVIAPAKVVLVNAKADSAGILVTWQKATGAHSYQVYRKTAGTGWKCVAKNIHDTEWKDIDAAKGTKYIYTVRAVADDGTTRGGYDAAGKTATVTKDPITPANVTLGKAVAGKNGITVTWSYAADARTYRVYRKAAGETKWTIMDKNAIGKSWTDTNVTKGTTYTYTVRGVNANGKLSPSHDKTGVSAVAK